MDVRSINTRHWQLSLERPGIVTDLEDIKQCIFTILTTRPGTDPLRPHFGCDLFADIDKPVNTAIPTMKSKILESLKTYEPRITIVKIEAVPVTDE